MLRRRLVEADERAPQDLAAIETAVPKGAAAGERSAASQMAHLDSETRHG